MAEAGEAFRRELAAETLRKPTIPVYANLTGEPYGEDVAATLGQQMCSPVRWEASVRGMIAAGADTFVELGPGKTLCGLIRKIDKTVKTLSALIDVAAKHAKGEIGGVLISGGVLITGTVYVGLI